MSAPPLAIVTGPQASTWLPSASLIAQVAGPDWDALSLRAALPISPGSGSLIAAPSASPAPPLCSVTVNPNAVPALTEVGSATFVSDGVAQLTVSVASLEPEPSLVLLKLAVLL